MPNPKCREEQLQEIHTKLDQFRCNQDRAHHQQERQIQMEYRVHIHSHSHRGTDASKEYIQTLAERMMMGRSEALLDRLQQTRLFNFRDSDDTADARFEQGIRRGHIVRERKRPTQLYIVLDTMIRYKVPNADLAKLEQVEADREIYQLTDVTTLHMRASKLLLRARDGERLKNIKIIYSKLQCKIQFINRDHQKSTMLDKLRNS